MTNTLCEETRFEIYIGQKHVSRTFISIFGIEVADVNGNISLGRGGDSELFCLAACAKPWSLAVVARTKRA